MKILIPILSIVLLTSQTYALQIPNIIHSNYSSAYEVAKWKPVNNASKYEFYKVTIKKNYLVKSSKLSIKYKKIKGNYYAKIPRKSSVYKVAVRAVNKKQKSPYSPYMTISKKLKRTKPFMDYLKSQITKSKMSINLDGYGVNDLQTMRKNISLILYQNPAFWQFDSTNEYIYYDTHPDGKGDLFRYYTNSYPDFKSQSKKASDILNKLKFGGNDYTKVKKIHDWIIQNTKYKHNKYDQNIYGVAVKKKAVCAGYANTFKYLCDRNGVKCATGYNDSHVWNYVKLDKWYIVDVTWDENNGYDYFLIGQENYPYKNNKTTEKVNVSLHDWGVR